VSHEIFEYITGACAVAWLIVQLVQGKSAAETKSLIGETNTLIREHIAGDVEKHAAIDKHLESTDGKVDRIERKIWN